MNILLTMAFNGARYHGFQVQKNALSVCTVLQNAMQQLLGERPDVKGCSRTDAGVHARGYCVSFRCGTGIPLDKLPLALNRFLPADVRVKKARQVPESFHARYSAVGKEYEYIFLNSRVDDPLAPGLYYRVSAAMDADAMHIAAQFLAGRHDFASFCSAGGSTDDTVRTISSLSVHRKGERIHFTVAADGFLYNMVRILAGTLLEVGVGKRPPEAVPDTLSACTRTAAGPTLPARGLFLNRVFYPEEALLL